MATHGSPIYAYCGLLVTWVTAKYHGIESAVAVTCLETSIIHTWPPGKSRNMQFKINYVPVVPHKAAAEVSKIGNLWEVGCCESGMAERSHWWTERCLISLTLSISFSDYLPTYLPIYFLCIYLSIDLSIYLSLSLSSNYPIYLSIYLSLSFICLSI